MNVQNMLKYTADLSHGVTLTPLRMAFVRGEALAHMFIITAYENNQKVDLTGATVNGYMMRGDQTTLTFDGSVSGGNAVISLPGAAYSVTGRFRLAIQATMNGVTTTLFYGEGAVSPSTTDIVAIPEEILMPSLENIEAEVERMKAATAAAEAVCRGAVVRNLLDNSDFRNPINQRGYVNGTPAPNAYFIDRWKNRTNGSFTLDANGLTLSGTHCFQIVSHSKFKTGQAYTIACKLGGDILCYSGVYGAAAIGDWSAGLVAAYEAERGVLVYLTMTNAAYKWAALYEGSYTAETLPAYQPKGYAAELAECQRYYENSWFGTTLESQRQYLCNVYTDNGMETIINFKTHKRIAATITLYPQTTFSDWRYYVVSGFHTPSTKQIMLRDGVSCFMIRFGKADTDTDNWAFGNAIEAIGHWEASADL